MPFKLRFSLMALIVAIAAISALAAYLVWQERSRYDIRHSAPLYALDMLEQTTVNWMLDMPGEVGGHCEIKHPPHPDHQYIIVMSIRSRSGKHIGMSGGPIINAALKTQPTIGYQGFYVPTDELSDFDLTDGTVWAEIRVLDRFDNVLFHGVKESETLEEAMARAGMPTPPLKNGIENPLGAEGFGPKS